MQRHHAIWASIQIVLASAFINGAHAQGTVYVHGKAFRPETNLDLDGLRGYWLQNMLLPSEYLKIFPSASLGEIMRVPGLQNSGTGGPENPVSCRPVVLATGAKLLSQQDFTYEAMLPLSQTRTYRSDATTGRLFGPNWMSSFDWPTLRIAAQGPYQGAPVILTMTSADGEIRTLILDRTANKFYPPGNSAGFAQGTSNGLSYYLGTKIYNYESGSYLLKSIQENGVLLYSFTYTGSYPYQLATVTNAYGAVLRFNWSTIAGNQLVSSIQAADGQYWYYAYDSAGNLKTVTPPGGVGVNEYHYENASFPKFITGYSIGGVRRTTYSYNSAGKVATSGFSNGEAMDSFVYGNLVTTKTEVNGQTTTYNFSASGNTSLLTSTSRSATSSCSATAKSQSYTPYGILSGYVDFNGNSTTVSYDSDGHLIQKTSAVGSSIASTESNSYSFASKTIQQRDNKDATGTTFLRTNFSYNNPPSGATLPTSVVRTDVARGVQRTTNTAYTFNAQGAVLSIASSRQLPSGSVGQTRQYDALGRLVSATNEVGHTTLYSAFAASGQPTRITDPNGVTTDIVYNTLGQPLTFTLNHPQGARANAISYEADGQVKKTQLSTNASVAFTYNSAGRLVRRSNALDESIQIDLDPAANIETSTAPRNIPILSGGSPIATAGSPFKRTKRNDSLGRSWILAGNSGQSSTNAYDGNGNIISITDASGRVIRNEYDQLNRVSKRISPDGGETKFTYEPTGAIRSVEDPRGLVTSYTSNAFGDILTETSPSTGITTYQYDTGGRRTNALYADGKSVSFTWDGMDRPLSRSSGGVSEVLTYDQGSYGKGRLTRIDDLSGSTTFSYGAAGEILQKSATIQGASFVANWTYDQAGRVQALTYPSGVSIQYSYDSYGRLTDLKGNWGAGLVSLATNFLYQPATDEIYAWRFSNGLPRMFTQDIDGRLTDVDSVAAHKLHFDYNIADTIWHSTNSNISLESLTIGYDPANRISAASGASSDSYFWDAAGNRTSQTVQGLTQAFSVAVDSNRLLSVSGTQWRNFQYDAVGNLASETRWDGSRSYAYDSFNRLRQVTVNGAAVGTYLYNAFNQRVQKVTPNGVSKFVYGDIGELLEETTPQGVTSYVWLAGQLLGIIKSGQFYASHNDQVGRPEVLTGSGGQIVWRASNRPFGRTAVAGTLANFNVGYPGQYFDSETGLWHNQHRYYDESLGRYTQSDPIGLAGGINTYAYVGGNPVHNIDPEGLSDINLFSTSENNYIAANRWNPSGVFSVAGHGNPMIMTVGGPNGPRITPRQLADMIKSNKKYKEGQAVMLGSCNTGNDGPNGSPSFAQELANLLKAPVTSPQGTAWFSTRDGLLGATKTEGEGPPVNGNIGPWKSFFPAGQ